MIPQAEVLDDAPAVRWSLAERVGFRFAFAIALLSLPQLSPMIANYMFFESLQSRAQAALGAFAGVELDPAGNMGAFVLSRLGGDHSRLADVIVRYLGDDPVMMRLRRVDPRKFPLLSPP